MGVGVYAKDFDGFGTTFLISPFDHITHENFKALPEEDRQNMDFEDFADLESENAQGQVDAVIAQVTRNFDGDFLKPEQRQWEEDMLIMAEIGSIQIYTRGWESDVVIGIAPHERARDILEGALKDIDPEAKLECIEELGASHDKVSERLSEQVEAVKRDLIAHFQEAGMGPRYKTSGYTTSPYNPVEPVHPENDEEAKKQKAIRLEPFAEFSDQDKLDAFEAFIEDTGLSNYHFMVNKDERGEFYADVRKILTDETVFEIKSDKNGEIPMVRDGFMKHKEDLEGLEQYLKEKGIMENTADLYFGGTIGGKIDGVEDVIYDALGSDAAREDLAHEYKELKEKVESEDSPVPR